MKVVKHILFYLAIGAIFLACSKAEKLPLFNNITIQNVTPVFNAASDCDTVNQGTFFTFNISFTNPDNENITYIEYDRIEVDGFGQFSYNLDLETLSQGNLSAKTCRRFYGNDFLKLRFFIVTEDNDQELRSQPFTITLDNPSQ